MGRANQAPQRAGGPRRPARPKLRLSHAEWRVHLAWLLATIPWVEQTQDRFRRAWKRTNEMTFWESYRYFGNVHGFLKGELYRTKSRLGIKDEAPDGADQPIRELDR